MAEKKDLTNRVRVRLEQVPRVKEKKMFGGIAFLVNGKMCVTVGHSRLMCRIDPEIHEEALKRKGSESVRMRGREYKGFIHVSEEGVRSNRDFEYWMDLALGYNKKAKASPKRKKK